MRKFNQYGLLLLILIADLCLADTPSREQVLSSMKTASQFMMDKVSYRGGFVWSYLPDFSRQWGELEAKRTMIWMQPPGTASMGHLMLDAYHATGDEFYYSSAQKIAEAIIHAQHSSGGWNYVADFAGEDSLKEWYSTIGKQAWRLEEFHRYYGNATFDDGGTAEAAKFLLRLYLEKSDEHYRAPLNKAIDFVLKSQYPIGGWPQRFPLVADPSDYSSFITFNDDVAAENIDFLLMCYQTLGDARLREPIIRAMNTYIVTQLGQPQPGWALQYTTELQPAAARSYEPRSLHTPTTAENILQLIKFYRLTGDSKFLARIPEAIDWLASLKIETGQAAASGNFPAFIELGTGRAMYTHRRGSNINSGEYYVDYRPGNSLAHYRSLANINFKKLRADYESALQIPRTKVGTDSPLSKQVKMELPKYFTLDKVSFSDLNFRQEAAPVKESQSGSDVTGGQGADVRKLLQELNAEGYWPVPLHYTTNRYSGEPPKHSGKRRTEQYSNTMVGDKWDTSPYPVDNPAMGISTGGFIRNMGTLIRYLEHP